MDGSQELRRLIAGYLTLLPINNTHTEIDKRFVEYLLELSDGVTARSNDPIDQEKSLVYNELMANAIVMQNVVDQTQALHLLKSQGIPFEIADLAHMSLLD